jgi:hypothetical protein
VSARVALTALSFATRGENGKVWQSAAPLSKSALRCSFEQ